MAKNDTVVKDTIPNSNSGMSLLSSIERYESLEAEKKDIADQQKEEKAAIKGMGFDMKIVNAILKRRRTDRSELEEQEMLIETYESAIEQAEAERRAVDAAAAAKKGKF